MQNDPEARMEMEVPVTLAQLAAVTLLTLVFLAAGLFVAALSGDLSMRPDPAHRDAQMLAPPQTNSSVLPNRSP